MEEKAANPAFNNRILKMYDPSFLTHMMMSEADPLYNSQLVDNRLFDNIQRANAVIS
jgi:hypothetical protein